MRHHLRHSILSTARRRFWQPAATLSLLLQSLPSGVSAAPCSYGEIFDFANTTGGGTSQVGTMTNLDIDRQPATVTVTNTGGGNLPAGVVGGGTSGFMASTHEYFFPGFTATSSPSYGHMLNLTGSAETPLTFTFSKSMRNLTMNLQGGDNKIFAFTDAAGTPVPFTIRSARGSFAGGYADALADPPSSGDGTNSFYVKQVSSSSIAVGEFGHATIAFASPVSVLKMTQTYARATLGTGATFNTAGSAYRMNFGQYCDQAGVVDVCNAPHPAEWQSVSGSGASGRVVDETGKVIPVTFQGGTGSPALQQNTASWTNGSNPASGAATGLFLLPVRPVMDRVSWSTTNTVATPSTLTWTFGESVSNPVLYLDGSLSTITTLRFFKADGATPLPFVLRNPADSDSNRQVDQNELYALTTLGSLVQFVGETTGIVMKVSGGANPFTGQGTLIMNCTGTLTAAGSAIDSDGDGDGVPDLTDRCPGTPAGAVVGSDGCPLPTDLSIAKTASVSKITPGVPFDYTITVTNTGAEATNVKASDIVPAGLTINSATASDAGVITRNGQSVQAVWAIVPNGGTRTLTINVTKP